MRLRGSGGGECLPGFIDSPVYLHIQSDLLRQSNTVKRASPDSRLKTYSSFAAEHDRQSDTQCKKREERVLDVIDSVFMLF